MSPKDSKGTLAAIEAKYVTPNGRRYRNSQGQPERNLGDALNFDLMTDLGHGRLDLILQQYTSLLVVLHTKKVLDDEDIEFIMGYSPFTPPEPK